MTTLFSTRGPLRSTATRILTLRAEADDLEREITHLVTSAQPQLLALLGVGAISAAQVLISWSHTGRFGSGAAFAAFSGPAPIPASSGLTTRHRLSRSGDRQLNRPLHTIALTRARIDPDTRLPRPPHRRRQDHPRSQAMPQTDHRPVTSGGTHIRDVWKPRLSGPGRWPGVRPGGAC